jgi:hypothetical protein
MPRILNVSAKCSDLFSASVIENGKQTSEYDGYVPRWFPSPASDNDGDYVILKIDIDTGKILNWKNPTQKDLKEFKPS